MPVLIGEAQSTAIKEYLMRSRADSAAGATARAADSNRMKF
jgi:hypothetical protein